MQMETADGPSAAEPQPKTVALMKPQRRDKRRAAKPQLGRSAAVPSRSVSEGSRVRAGSSPLSHRGCCGWGQPRSGLAWNWFAACEQLRELQCRGFDLDLFTAFVASLRFELRSEFLRRLSNFPGLSLHVSPFTFHGSLRFCLWPQPFGTRPKSLRPSHAATDTAASGPGFPARPFPVQTADALSQPGWL